MITSQPNRPIATTVLKRAALLGAVLLLAGCGGGGGGTSNEGFLAGLESHGIDVTAPEPEPPGILEVSSTVYKLPGGILHVFTFPDGQAAKIAAARVDRRGTPSKTRRASTRPSTGRRRRTGTGAAAASPSTSARRRRSPTRSRRSQARSSRAHRRDYARSFLCRASAASTSSTSSTELYACAEMRRFPSRSDVTIPSRPSARDELRRVLRADADQRAAPLRPPRSRDLGAELVQALDQPRVELVHVLARLRDADLLHQLDPGDARVDRGHRRRPRLEAAAVGAGE